MRGSFNYDDLMFKISREVVESFSDLGKFIKKFIIAGKQLYNSLINIKILH